MNTTGNGFFRPCRMAIVVCLMITQYACNATAQVRPDEETIGNFFYAIQVNDTNTFFTLLDGNTNLANAFYSGHLPLHRAVSLGNIEMVDGLLKHGADINAQNDSFDSSGMRLTALQIAIWYGKTNLCRLLLAAGADPNIQSTFEGSALHYAFNYRHTEMADWLLDYGADPFLKKQNPYNQVTPLEMAISQGDGKLVPRMLGQDAKHPLGNKSLIKKSAPPKHPRQPVKTPSDFLVERGGTLLAIAARRGENEAVQALLHTEAAKGKTEDGTPLLQAFAVAEAAAARGNNFESNRWFQIRDLLIKNGADYDVFAATAMGDIDQARKLLSADKNRVQAADKDGQTPLCWAVQNDQLTLTAFWLQAGASPAATNFAGQTALHLAAGKNLVEHMKLLLSAHAPTDALDTKGWTPLDAATHAQNTEAIRLLLSDKSVSPPADRAIATALHDTAASGNLAALIAVTETTNNLEARNELGLTPMQVAVLNGHFAEAALLLDRGANASVRDADGNTLLHKILLQEKNFYVQDRPPTNWLDRMGQDPRKSIYAKYLTVGQNEQGPNPVLQAASFLIACGVDAKATNRAGQTVMQLVTQGKISRSIFFFEDDREKLFKLLGGAGGNIDQRDASGNTAMHQSVNVADANEVDRLAGIIAGGADVNATNTLGQTPLHKAAERIWGWDGNNPPVNEPFQLLLYHKANVNAQDNEGQTPLHVLAATETSFKREATRALLDAGANPNLADKHGRTPVHLFLSGKWPWSESGECVDMLVQAGANLSAKDDQGKTPLHYLAAVGDQKPMFFIRGLGDILVAAKVDVQVRDSGGNTPLQIAAKTGTRDVFDWLVKQGANLDATNNAGETPRLQAAHSIDPFAHFGPANAETDIFQAVRDGNVDAATRLVKADPQLANQTNQFGQTPLRLAVTMHQTNMMSFLETHGAHWDEASAVMAGRVAALHEILQRKPSSVTTTALGKGLAHIAAVNGDVEILKLLIATKCDLAAQDAWGLSPLGYALIKKNQKVQELLRQHSATENFFDAVYADDLPTVTALLSQNKILVSVRNRSNKTALDIAAAAGYTDILKLLLKGTSLNSAASGDGQYALHLAAFYDQTNALSMLIRAGAKVDQADRVGLTPLHWASVRGATEAAVILLRHKAEANRQIAKVEPENGFMMGPDRGTIMGDTALHLAALCGEINLVQLLIKSGADVNAINAMQMTPLDLADSHRPMNPFGIVMLQRSMVGLLEPLGKGLSPATPFKVSRAGQNVAALIEAAGGKHSATQQSFRSWPGPQ